MMCYENRNTFMYKVLGEGICTIIDEYIFVLIIWVYFKESYPRTTITSKYQVQLFSGLGILDIFMNIMSCHGFVKSSVSTVILTCHNYLVMYYLSKGFVVVETEVGGVDNIPMFVKTMLLIYMNRRVFQHTKRLYPKLSIH